VTPHDIYNKKFEKSAVGGYKMEDVNRFLVDLGDYIDDLLTERDELDAKLEFLAEKVEEYRADEESLRVAVVSAHKLGESVMRDAKEKAEAILAEATKQSEEMISAAKQQSDSMLLDIRTDMATESYAMASMKASVVKFRRQILTMYERQIDLIHSIPFNEDEVTGDPVRPAHLLTQELSAPPSPAHDDIPEISESIAGDELSYESAEEKPQLERPRRSQTNFGPLLFGEDFSLTRHE